jgi:hypothetical protein
MKQTLLLLVLFFFFTVGITNAHPGRTDASGGHTCRTNCDSWGYGYGEYHYHGGGTSSGSTGGTYTAPAQESVEETVILPTNTPIPIRIPTKTPTSSPTKTPTPTPKPTVTPTKRPTPTILPTQKVQGIQSNAAPQKQGFFAWLLSFFGM